MSLISVVTACMNEEDNVTELHARIKAQFENLPAHSFEHIFVDNASTDGTVKAIKALAARDKRVKLLVNTRNFGPIRSPLHAVFLARGDAIICMASDLQDSPELIPRFIEKWQAGFKAVLGVKPKSRETFLMSFVRGLYYRLLGWVSEVPIVSNFTGFGLYDRSFIEIIRKIDDPYPYFRGFVTDLGIDYTTIQFEQPKRVRGFTKNNFYTLYDMAMLGFTNHSKLPIRLAAMAGFLLAAISLAFSLFYLVYKVLYWQSFELGIAPLVISLFFFSSVQLLFIGVIGEYIGAIHTHVRKRPLVVEKERVNFDPE